MSAIMPRTARARPAQAKRRRRSRVSWSSREGIGSRQPVRACSYCVIARSCATRAMRSWPGSEGGRRASNTVPLAEFMVLRNAGRFCRWDVASCAPHAPCRSRCLRRRGLVYGRPCDTPTSRPAPRTVRDSLNVRLWWNRSDWSEAVSSWEAPVQGCRRLGGRAAPQVRDRPPRTGGGQTQVWSASDPWVQGCVVATALLRSWISPPPKRRGMGRLRCCLGAAAWYSGGRLTSTRIRLPL
jgi:hypothetical protein